MMRIRKRLDFLLWLFKIKPSINPPRFVKEKVINFYARKYNIDILIETGTYEGEMVSSLKDNFREIFSIELSKVLAENAKKMFSKEDHIKIIWGDSGQKLKEILKKLSSPCLFWLDAHYSGGKSARGKKETPVMEELKEIMNHSERDIVLINDANNFGEGNYPSYNEIKEIIDNKFKLQVKNNIIRIIPK